MAKKEESLDLNRVEVGVDFGFGNEVGRNE
jgi:hypothetical protein